ncbi:putative transmembrane protein [Gregarina niphandrodes]|uniref:Transmembrane protein n=1 Tax=Gregarina niphandrodes TaxID=110365 RepID=A0A023B0V6_GRENI|nr:putative transmembrane protein [Gregarina niphandrodes]EZG45467.1 putative transmembrane protein [Gregarina niphandrodes]|eukprot:XP_011132485.1 putative transmembrane protein [Gregarina niphandrodes]
MHSVDEFLQTTSRWMRQSSSAKVIIILMALLSLFSGVMQTLVLKWQNRMRVLSCTRDPVTGLSTCTEKYFHQAFIQTFVMFLGECLAVPFILLSNKSSTGTRDDFRTEVLSREAEQSTRLTSPDTSPNHRSHQHGDRVAYRDRISHGNTGRPRGPQSAMENVELVGGRQSPWNPTVADLKQDFVRGFPLSHSFSLDPEDVRSLDARSLETSGGGLRTGLPARREAPLWWWMTPAPLDFCECALGCIAVTITYASTVQMLHNFMVICSAVFTILILRYPLRVHEWLGSLVVTVALILCGIPALRNPEEATEVHSDYQWLGILLALVSTCVHSLQNIWEEALFRKCDVDATVAIGLEGLTGAIISGAALPVVQWTGYEHTREGARQLIESSQLRWGCVLFGISSLLNNLCGIAVTRWANGLLRCLFMSLRPPMVWLCEMYLSWNTFDWYNFASMFVLAAGLFIYMLLPPLDRFGGDAFLTPVTFGIQSWWREQPTANPPFAELSNTERPETGLVNPQSPYVPYEGDERDGIAYGGHDAHKPTPMTSTPVV